MTKISQDRFLRSSYCDGQWYLAELHSEPKRKKQKKLALDIEKYFAQKDTSVWKRR